MTYEPRAWERPDGIGEDPRVDILAARLCVSVEGGRDEARAMLTRLDAAAPVAGEDAASPGEDELYERLAAIQHDIWSHWMKYLLNTKAEDHGEAGLWLTEGDVARWREQANTAFVNLTEREKASDREQVDRFWHLVAPGPPSVDEIARTIDEAFDADFESRMSGGGPVSREDMARDAAERIAALWPAPAQPAVAPEGGFGCAPRGSRDPLADRMDAEARRQLDERGEAAEAQSAAPTRDEVWVSGDESGPWRRASDIGREHDGDDAELFRWVGRVLEKMDGAAVPAAVLTYRDEQDRRCRMHISLGQLRHLRDLALSGGGADSGGEDEDPNLAHRSAIDTAKLSGPETQSLLLCARDGRVGGAATIGDSRLNASIVWAMLGNGGTPADVHRSYPWCSVEDADVLGRLRRDVVERGGADGGGEDDGPKLAEHAEKTGRCSQCGKPFGESACGPTHASAACVYFGGSDRVMAIKAIRDERDEATQRLRSAIEDAQARGAMHAQAARTAIVSRLARAAGVSPDSEDPVGAIEAAIRAGREPEVVTGAEAANLPVGSRLVLLDSDGLPREHAGIVVMDDPARWGRSDRSFLVVMRAPVPAPAPLTVGEVIEEAADLDRRATVGTIVEGADEDAARRGKTRWWITGEESGAAATELTYPVTIVRVGTGGDSDA